MAPEIDGKLYLNDLEPRRRWRARAAQPGDMVTVEITESHDYDLVGRVVEIQESSPTARPLAANAAMAPVHKISTGAALRVLA